MSDEDITKIVNLYNNGGKYTVDVAPGDIQPYGYSLSPERYMTLDNIELKNSYGFRKVIVPGKTLQEISKIIGGESEAEVEISFTQNHVVFEFGNTLVVSRLIEGEYFRIDQMLSSDYETKVTGYFVINTE